METCQGQEWGTASTPFTTLRVAVLGVTAGLPQSAGQAGNSNHSNRMSGLQSSATMYLATRWRYVLHAVVTCQHCAIGYMLWTMC